MKLASLTTLWAVSALCGTILSPLSPVAAHAQLSSNVSVYVSGLEGPRGLKFGPDGELYVAEAGLGGAVSTVGQCARVPAPVGPYHGGGDTARISKITRGRERVTVASGFPSSQDSLPSNDVAGVADIAFLDGHLYALLGGAGCSHASSFPNAILRVDAATGHWKMVANLSEFLKSHPAMYPNAGDFEPDGTFYNMIAYNGGLLAVEPNHGQIFSISTGGAISEMIDISQAEGHIVPTSMVERNGDLLVGNLGLFPVTPNSSKILTLTECISTQRIPGLDRCEDFQKLKVSGSRAGFTTVVALDFGPDGLLYAPELSSAAGNPGPNAGKVVRLNRDGKIEDVATGLTVPTGMTFGPDGYLYVSNLGAVPGSAGQIVRISVP